MVREPTRIGLQETREHRSAGVPEWSNGIGLGPISLVLA